MATEAQKIQHAYSEGKAYRQPEIDALNARIAELEKLLAEANKEMA